MKKIKAFKYVGAWCRKGEPTMMLWKAHLLYVDRPVYFAREVDVVPKGAALKKLETDVFGVFMRYGMQ